MWARFIGLGSIAFGIRSRESRLEEMIPIFGEDIQRAFVLEPTRRGSHGHLRIEMDFSVNGDSLGRVGVFAIE